MLRVRGNQLFFNDKAYRCAIGKGGFAADKREGDGATPLGVFPLRECWYRADRLQMPQTGLPIRVIEQNDGWCDDPESPDYNKHVTLPYSFSHEELWRQDSRYDLIVPLGYNDGPVLPGKGSAIFMHIAAPDYSGTEGCIALAQEDLLEVLAGCDSKTMIDIGEK
jgi:L,D-peptidoglycan transpeptidase YkuD (ErfK/YbiS/YcfS/YnhG family)